MSRNGAAVALSCKDGNLVSDDGKPRDKVSDTVENMAAPRVAACLDTHPCALGDLTVEADMGLWWLDYD